MTFYNPCASFDLDFDDEPTWPGGNGELEVEDKYTPLFTSATWAVTAKVNGRVVATSSESQSPHSPAFVKRWIRQLIRENRKFLGDIGVQVVDEYVKWGGRISDLSS